MTERVRLADLARQAGVSTATVSRVLNGKETVAPATRQAVLTALDLLGYERPERLRQRPGGLIGLIVPELSNPIFPSFAQNLETTMAARGYTPLLCTQTAGGITEDAYVQLLLDQRVSGIIFLSGLHADSSLPTTRYARLKEMRVPFVTLNGAHEQIDAPDVSTDHTDAVAQAVRHLISLGHTRIGLALGPARFTPSQHKEQGYRQVMASLLPDSPLNVANTLYTVEGGQAAAGELLDDGCTGLICGSDVMALGAIRQCEGRGLRVPADVSVVGFDDSALMAFSSPPLTTVRQPVRAMSEAAVSLLLSIIDEAPVSQASLKFHAELIVRDSTASHSPPPHPRS